MDVIAVTWKVRLSELFGWLWIRLWPPIVSSERSGRGSNCEMSLQHIGFPFLMLQHRLRNRMLRQGRTSLHFCNPAEMDQSSAAHVSKEIWILQEKREPGGCLFCSQMETKVWVTHAWFNPSAICRGTREDECHDPSVSLSAPFSLSAVPNLSSPSALEQGGTRPNPDLWAPRRPVKMFFYHQRRGKGIVSLHHGQIVSFFSSIWMIVEESNHQVLFNPPQNLLISWSFSTHTWFCFSLLHQSSMFQQLL